MTVPVPTRRRRLLERSWIVVSVAYGGVRIFVADHTVKRYGVNIWAFAFVELSTSWLYGLSTARVVAAFVDRTPRQALRWGAVAAATFLAPEAFIVVTARHVPRIVYAIVATLVTVLGTLAVTSLVRKIRTARTTHTADAATRR